MSGSWSVLLLYTFDHHKTALHIVEYFYEQEACNKVVWSQANCFNNT